MLQGVLKRENPVRGELVQPFHADYSMTMFDHQLDYWSPQNRDARWPRLGVSGSVSDTNNWGHTGSDMMLLEGAYMRTSSWVTPFPRSGRRNSAARLCASISTPRTR